MHSIVYPWQTLTRSNEWSATSPQPAVHLLESWDPILPSFIRDNILDQLILPKVRQAIEEWDGRPSRSGKTRSLSGIVFPWLPLLGHRMDDILDGSKRRIRSVMRKWVVRDGMPEELARWRKDVSGWLCLGFHTDGRSLQAKNGTNSCCAASYRNWAYPCETTFPSTPENKTWYPWKNGYYPGTLYSDLPSFLNYSKSTFSRNGWIYCTFGSYSQISRQTKWPTGTLPILIHAMLTVRFTWWKSRFPEKVLSMPGVAHGFTAGLNLMQDAMRLGPDAPSKLRKAVYDPPKVSSSKTKSKPASTVRVEKPVETGEITFRSLVEDIATQNDLVFFPIGRSHDITGKPLFRVSKNADGRGGVLVYVAEDAVFAQGEDGQFRAVSLDGMVQRALA